MTLKAVLCATFVMAGLSASAASDIHVSTRSGDVTVQFFTPSIVRVSKTPAGTTLNRPSLVVVAKPGDVTVSRKGKNTFVSSALKVTVNSETSCVTFADARGKVLLREQKNSFEPRTSGPEKGSFRVTQTFTLDKNEPVYGLGTIQDGKINRRGTEKLMEQSNLEDFQNVLQSVKGWGIYWDNYSRTLYKDNAAGMTFSSEVGEGVDYYFMYGGSVDGVNAQMRELTGQVPMFPLWTFGFWQSKERYKSTEEVIGVVDEYRKLLVPLDGIIQDWQYWGSNYTWNAMEFIADTYLNGKEMIEQAHERNAHMMISIWQSFGPQTKQFKELGEKGMLYGFETWPQSGLTPWPPRMDYPSGVRVYDAFNPEARDIYWKYLKNLFDQGIDGWWMDSTDPDFFNAKDSDYDNRAGDATFRRYRNAFPLACVQGVYDHQRKESSDKRVFIMTRSSFAGQQRYGSNMWTGDVTSSWDMLRKQVPCGQSFSMTGNPNFNTDIGGFFAGQYNTDGDGSAPLNAQYQELYVRWMQYALFNPVFRSHGADAPQEIWQFGKKGEPTYDAIEKAIRLRYQMLPYIYSTAWQVTSAQDSYIRPLFSDFAQDKKTWDIPNEFMFGRSILALPITDPLYTPEDIVREDGGMKIADFSGTRSVTRYLPKGAKWYDFWTNKMYDGGRNVSLETTYDRAPMFVRAGSILPLAPVVQYTNGMKWDNLELRLYPGADGTFTLYEDEGDNYNYEKGAYSTITFSWDNAHRTLTIAPRKGEYKGMLARRTFNIVLAGSSQEAKRVEYTGEAMTVKL